MASRTRTSARNFQNNQGPSAGARVAVIGGVLVLVVVLVMVGGGGGGKKTAPKQTPRDPAPATATPPPKTTPKKKVPATVPLDFKQRVEREWASLEARGNEALRHFNAAKDAKVAGDRAALQREVQAGKEIYDEIIPAWSAIYYAIDDYPENVGAACRSWVSPKERVAKKWSSRFKALKELWTQ